jgi:hypothetical protein
LDPVIAATSDEELFSNNADECLISKTSLMLSWINSVLMQFLVSLTVAESPISRRNMLAEYGGTAPQRADRGRLGDKPSPFEVEDV